jgi:hypothetical protein
MTPKLITNKVKALLAASTALKFTINGVATQTPVFTGVDGPDFVFDNGLPFIAINPAGNALIRKRQGDVEELRLSLLLTGYLPVRDREDSIVGTATYPGIYDLEAGIKSGLNAYYPALDGVALHFEMTTFEYSVSGDGLGRMVGVELRVDYRA